MAKSKKPKTPKPAKKPIAKAPPDKLTDEQLDQLSASLGMPVPSKAKKLPPPVDYDQFAPVEPLLTEANLAKLGIPATPENINSLMSIAGSTYISDVDDFRHVLETFYPQTLAAMKAKASLTAPPPSLVGKKPAPIVDDPWAEDATFIPAKEKPAKEPKAKPKPAVVVTEKGDSPYEVGQVVPYDEFHETALEIYKVGGLEPFATLQGSDAAEVVMADDTQIKQAQQNAVAKAKATPLPSDIKHQDQVEKIFQQIIGGDMSQGPGEFLRRLQGMRSSGVLTNREATDLATRANSWATDLLRKKQQDSITKYADFLIANGANPSTVQRVLSGQLDMSPRARAERALEMGLDPGMVWQRVDDPMKTRFQGRARAGLTYAGFNEALARAAAMTGEYSKRYPLIGSPKLLGLRAADTPLVPVKDQRQAIEMIWNQLPNAYDGTGRRLVRTNGMDLLFPSSDALYSYMSDPKLGDEGFKMGLHEEVSELMSHTKHAARVDALVRENGPAVRRYLQAQADRVAVDSRGEAKGTITLPNTAKDPGGLKFGSLMHPVSNRHLAPPHFNDVEFGGFGEEPSGTADLKRTLDNRRKRAFRQYLRDAGLEGLLVDDEAGTSVAFDQPNRLRHAELAALDPNVADQPNIYNSVMPLMAAATGGALSPQVQQQLDKYDGSQVPPGEIPEWLMATPYEEQEQEQDQFQGFPPMQPNEGFGEYLIRTGQAQRATPYKRRAVDDRTSMGKMLGDFNTDITNQELEDWYVSLDEKPNPEHEQFKQSLAATLDEPVFTGTPTEEMPYQGGAISTDADGYEPMNFNQWFLSTIQPLVWDKTGVNYDAVDNMREQVLAKLMGEPYDFDDPDVELYTTMALDNLREGQTADEFPAMPESEAAEAQQKYGANARYYLGNDRQENRARENAYRLAQTFANGEHAPPGVGAVPAALATAGQTINAMGDLLTISPQNSDGGDGYDNARLAVDALSGIQGRLRSANYWSRRGAEQPELAFDQITGANSPNESATNMAGLQNKMAKSDGYYQFGTNVLKSLFDTGSTARYEHERLNNRTTPIVPDEAVGDPEQYDDRAEAARLFEEHKQGSEDYAPAMAKRLFGRTTPFVNDLVNLPRELFTDPMSLATLAGGGIYGLMKGGLSALPAVAASIGSELVEEGVEGAALGGGFGGYDYFFTPNADNALTGDVDPRDANAYKEALEAGLMENEQKLQQAINLMKPRSPVGQSLLPQEVPPAPRRRRPFMTQMPPKAGLGDLE